MTTKHQEIAERLSREFEIGDRHIQRIEEALTRLSSVLPLSTETYSGAKLFRYILEYLDEDISSLPMRDILNRLERYHLIDSAEEWVYIRELRNEIAHDYPLFENDIVNILNELILKVSILKDIYGRLKNVYSNK